ncbi:hypothetical protein MASR2M70_13590 [Bacillota bacterium]
MAYLGDYGYLRAVNISIKAESLAKANAHCMSAAASLVGRNYMPISLTRI